MDEVLLAFLLVAKSKTFFTVSPIMNPVLHYNSRAFSATLVLPPDCRPHILDKSCVLPKVICQSIWLSTCKPVLRLVLIMLITLRSNYGESKFTVMVLCVP